MTDQKVVADLSRWAQAEVGPAVTVTDVERMPGHSGITYSFALIDDEVRRDVVMRMPPAGVRRQANLDVTRLAPLLSLMRDAGVTVPSVIASSDDERWFGVPYLMVERVAGAPLPDVFESPAAAYPGQEDVAVLFRQAMEQLALVHRADPSPLLDSGWGRPVGLMEDLDQWLPLLAKSDEPEAVRRTRELGARLRELAPSDDELTIVHGDFYSNNWLYDEGQFTGLLDWENATIARPTWDLGWVTTIYDPGCWGPGRAPEMTWCPTTEHLLSWYEAASGRTVRHAGWYQALMCYRFACITPAKLRLHRTGRHVDPVWEMFAEAIPYQLDRAHTLLSDGD